MAVIQGEEFDALREEVSQDRVDTAKVRELLGTRISEVMKTISFTVTKIVRRDPTKAPMFTPPHLANYTNSGLIDHLGKVREQIKILEKEEGIVKAALDARLAMETTTQSKTQTVSPSNFASV